MPRQVRALLWVARASDGMTNVYSHVGWLFVSHTLAILEDVARDLVSGTTIYKVQLELPRLSGLQVQPRRDPQEVVAI